ncbi:MAG: gliding motility protein GldM [Fimbriimonadaceae bacterium]|nr:gliding motility protein GldM [Chitinophagales bacterium]
MSIPKEPRQLMINLMYLVLTAMLALNVSAEILNAFNLVNRGISDSNDILTQKSTSMMAAINSAAAKDNRPNTQQMLANAQQAQTISNDFVAWVETLKEEIKVAAGGENTEDPNKFLKTEGETEKTSHLLLKEGKAEELKQKIEEARGKFLALVGNDASIDIPLKVTDVPADSKKDWAEYNFDRVPAIAVTTILTKLQQDARSAENSILDVLGANIDKFDYKIDQMVARVVAPTAYVKRGNEYTADIFVAATSKQANPEVYLGSFNGKVIKDANGDYNVIEGTEAEIPLSGARKVDVVNGMGKIKEAASGAPTYQGVVKMAVPNSDKFKYYPFDFGYETFEVGGAVVSPTSMNVLYVGIENPIKISVPGYVSDKVSASGCNIKKIKGEEYTANPSSPGVDNINVTVNTPEGVKSYKNEFRVRRIPDPYPYLSTSKGGTIKKSEFTITDRVDAKNVDFVFQVPYQVVGFELVYVPAGGGSLVSDYAKGPGFTSLMQEIKKKAKPGDRIMLNDVKVRMPDGTTRSVSTTFKLI